MNLRVRYWSTIVPSVVVLALCTYATVGAPFGPDGQLCRVGRFTIPSPEWYREAGTLAEVIGESPLEAVAIEDVRLEEVMMAKRTAEESEGDIVRNTGDETRRERPKELNKRTNNSEEPQSPKRQQANEKDHLSPRPYRFRTRFQPVTPEEVEMVLSPEQITEYKRLEQGTSVFRQLERKKAANEKAGLPFTGEDELEARRRDRNQFQKMQRVIQNQLIASGDARQEVVEKRQEWLKKHRESNRSYQQNMSPDKREKTREKKNDYSKQRRREETARYNYLIHKKYTLDGLTSEEQRELDAIRGKRKQKSRKDAIRLRAKKQEAKQLQGETQEEQGDVATQKQGSGGDKSRVEVSTEQQPGTMESSSTGQTEFWMVDKPPPNHFIKRLPDIGKNIWDSLSRTVGRVNTDSAINHTSAPGIRAPAPGSVLIPRDLKSIFPREEKKPRYQAVIAEELELVSHPKRLQSMRN